MTKTFSFLLALPFFFSVMGNTPVSPEPEAKEMPTAHFTPSKMSQMNLTEEEKACIISEILKTGSCEYDGIKLHGKVQIVTSFPDIKVQDVSSFPDIKVKWVTSFPDDCGEWQEVTSFPDFKIQYVTSFPDLKVQEVTSFPGMN